MKKFLTVMSLLLVAMMVFSVIPASAADNGFTAPEGIQKYYANDISGQEVPVIDGIINEGEYGDLTVKISDHITYAHTYPDCDSKIDDDRVNQPAPEAIDFYFAYDENYIYIAYVDYGAEWDEDSLTAEFLASVCGDQAVTNYLARNNYMVATGFFLEDLTSYWSLNASSRGFDENRFYDMGAAAGDVAALDLVDEIYLRRTLASDPSKVVSTYDGTQGSNANSAEGRVTAVCEIKYSKAHVIETLNEQYFYDFTELPNAMWFYFLARSYVFNEDLAATNSNALGYNRYFVTDIRENQGDYFDWGVSEGSSWQSIPGLIIFGDENTELSIGKFASDEPEENTDAPAVDTDAPAADTDAPAADTDAPAADTDAPATDAPATDAPADDAKGGCGGSVTVAALALVAALGTCTVFVAKKKED